MSKSKKEKRKLLAQLKNQNKQKFTNQTLSNKNGITRIRYLPDTDKVELTIKMEMIPPSQTEYLQSLDPKSIDIASEKLKNLNYTKVSDSEIQS
ncbi:hypothetical protein KQJ29_15280, partial [Enterococcus sp. S181_ASV_20]|nr:hypothetical protein [Enterococcus sp. S181_ASV_20]